MSYTLIAGKAVVALWLTLWVGVGVAHVKPIVYHPNDTFMQSSPFNGNERNAVEIEELNRRIKVLEDQNTAVLVAKLDQRSEVDHQLIMGIALAVIGMIVETVMGYNRKKGQ